MNRGWRWGIAITAKVIVAVMNVDSGSGMARIFVDGILHLAEEVVDLNKILLRPGVGHG